MIRKSLTAAALASLILGGVLAPAAMADKKPTYPESKKYIYLNGNLVTNAIGLVAKDPNTHRATTYMPLWYVFQALKQVGVTYTWDGSNLNIKPAPGMTITLTNLHPGNEDTKFYINGTLVDTAVRLVAKDPYSHVNTTYIPIWYIQYVLGHMGVVSTWDGTNWDMTVHVNSVQKLSLSVATQAVGTGQSDVVTVTATYADGLTKAVPANQVTWTTNDTADAFVSPSGQFIATKPGTYTVTAQYQGVSQTTQIQVYGATSAIHLNAKGDLVANGVSTDTVTVTANDANGLPAQNENGTVVISTDQPWLVTGTANGHNTLGQSTTVQLKGGVGTLAIQAPTTPGLTVHLTSSQLSDGNANIQYGNLSLTSVPQVATSLSVQPVNGQKYLVANQGGNTAAFTVNVNDQAGQPMLSGYYPFNIAVSGSASYTGPATGVYVAGQTAPTITVQSNQGATGPVTVSVTGNNLGSASSTIQAVIAQQASKLVATAAGSSTSFAEGGSITYALSAVDANGLPTTYPSTAFTAYVTNAQGQVASNILVNGAAVTSSGVSLGSNQSIALSDNTSAADAGTYTMTIKDPSGNVWTSFPVNETAAAAAKLSLTSAASEVSVANPTTTLKLQYTDAYGNPTSAPDGGALKLVASGGQGGSTINGQNATQGVQVTPDASGAAQVTFSAQPYAGSSWTVSASDGKLTSNAVTVSIMNTLVSQATVALKDGSTGSTTQATAGDPLQFTFGAVDNYNNSYNGTDTFVVTYPTRALSGVTGGTDANGTTTVSGTLSQLAADFSHAQVAYAQTLTVKIADQSVSTATPGTTSIYVVPGQFSQFGVFDSQNQPIDSTNPVTASTNAPVELWVKPVDSMGNPVTVTSSVYTVDLSSNPTGGSFRTTPTGSDINQVTFPIGAGSEPVYFVAPSGSYTVSAVASVVSPAKSSVKLSGYQAYQSNPAQNGSGTLTVVLKDQNGLPVTGQSSALTAAASATGVSIGSFTESAPGTYTAHVTSTANVSGVTITVKDGSTTIGSTDPFNS